MPHLEEWPSTTEFGLQAHLRNTAKYSEIQLPAISFQLPAFRDQGSGIRDQGSGARGQARRSWPVVAEYVWPPPTRCICCWRFRLCFGGRTESGLQLPKCRSPTRCLRCAHSESENDDSSFYEQRVKSLRTYRLLSIAKEMQPHSVARAVYRWANGRLVMHRMGQN
jgi:hypothetical protein